MSYTVEIPRSVEKYIDRLQQSDALRVLDAIDGLATNPRPHGAIKLTARPGYRIRVGRFRVIYDIDDTIKVVSIEDVDDRGNVYR